MAKKAAKTTAKKSVIYRIYADLVGAFKDVIETKYIFLANRPKVSDSDEPMQKFVVIDLPVSITDICKGKKKRLLSTDGVFYLFTQARSNSTLDVNIMGDFIESVEALFPYIGECCSISDPIVRMTGSDEYGYQVTTITFDLQTKWKVFDTE